MSETHASCLALARGLPERMIRHEGGDYLSRWTVDERPGGGWTYLHFFHRGDHGRDLHCHPWGARSRILVGGYREIRRLGCGATMVREYLPGDLNVLEPDTYHRVDLLDPAGCWTRFETGPASSSWSYMDPDTGEITPWRKAHAARGLKIENFPRRPRA